MEIIIANCFKIKKQINQGTFGQIYSAINTKTGQNVAVKFQAQMSKFPQLLNEARIIKHLLNDTSVTNKGIPNVYYAGAQGQFNVMVMDLLGPSLQQMFKKMQRSLTLKTTLMIADQMLKRVQYVHQRGILHRDVKPDNFLLGQGDKNKKLYLIDFGLSKKYIKDNKHIKYIEGLQFTGTARFASLNTHLGIEPTRRDDLESLFYCLCYFMLGQLPWQGQKANTKQAKFQKIMAKKVQFRPQLLCQKLPPEFLTFFNHIRGLKFDQKPNYELLKTLIKNSFKSTDIDYDFYFDWDKAKDEMNKFAQKK